MDADAETRLANINQHFLRGLLNTEEFTHVSFDNCDFTTGTLPASVTAAVTTDLTATAFPTTSDSTTNVYNVFVDLRAHLNTLTGLRNGSGVATPAFPLNMAMHDVAVKYGNVVDFCLKGKKAAYPTKAYEDTSGCPLMRSKDSVVFVRGSRVPNPNLGTPYGGHAQDAVTYDPKSSLVTYYNSDPADTNNAAASKRLNAVVNTYTVRRLALYYVLTVNATVLAYDKIMLAKASASNNDTLEALYKLTMEQFVELNDLYSQTAPTGKGGVPVVPISYNSSVPYFTAFQSSQDAAAAALTRSGTAWATAVNNTQSPVYYGVSFAAKQPAAKGVVITPHDVDASTLTIAIPQVFTYASGMWDSNSNVGFSSSKTFDVTSNIVSGAATNAAFKNASSAQPVNWTPGQTWVGAPASYALTDAFQTLIITNGDVNGVASVGFQRLSLPAMTPSVATPADSGFKYVWAGTEDLLYPAKAAVGANVSGWSTPTLEFNASNAPIPVAKDVAYWAGALSTAVPYTSSYTVYPFPDGRPMPTGWTVALSSTAPLSAAPATVSAALNGVTWNDVATEDGLDWSDLGPKTFVLPSSSQTSNVTFVRISVRSKASSDDAATYGDMGFLALTVNHPDQANAQRPTVDVMQSMDDLEARYQHAVELNNSKATDFATVQRDVRRGAHKAQSAGSSAKVAWRVQVAALVIALLCVVTTLLATLMQLSDRVRVMAGALLVGVMAAIGVLLATWLWG